MDEVQELQTLESEAQELELAKAKLAFRIQEVKSKIRSRQLRDRLNKSKLNPIWKACRHLGEMFEIVSAYVWLSTKQIDQESKQLSKNLKETGLTVENLEKLLYSNVAPIAFSNLDVDPFNGFDLDTIDEMVTFSGWVNPLSRLYTWVRVDNLWTATKRHLVDSTQDLKES